MSASVSASAAERGSAGRRAELREFLISCRARISPQQAGFPAGGGKRRTPGLRREEVAVLAGVGVSWYQWLEQGRDITVSPQVLDSVGRVLELTDAELRHLYALAGLNPPILAPDYACPVDDSMTRLLDSWLPNPGHILDPHWNVVAANRTSQLVFNYSVDSANCLIVFFTDRIHRSRYLDWWTIAPRVVAQFRAEMTARPEDPGYLRIVEELKARSPEFAELWSHRDVEPGGVLIKAVTHPLVGDLIFESTLLQIPNRPDLRLVLHNALHGTDTAAKLSFLLSQQDAERN
ncbi:MAG: helix-turn-helix transcriptional regulator [Actinocrinis sp.]